MIFLLKQVVFKVPVVNFPGCTGTCAVLPSLRQEYLPSPTVARYANVDQFLPQQKVAPGAKAPNKEVAGPKFTQCMVYSPCVYLYLVNSLMVNV